MHREILESKAMGADIDRITKIRRSIHQNAEIAFKEFKTQKLIRDTLISFGLDEDSIQDCAGTGLVVNIWGTGNFIDGSKNRNDIPIVKSVALRADMDALPMKENNPHLDYKTKTN